jgi:putative pyruvate formate lyase activating enzyme
VYCQNYDISQMNQGREITEAQLVEIMLQLQDSGAHNINLVTPTHFSAQIVAALEMARASGLELPVVYNSSGYDAPDVLKEFEGLIDIYMPDMRYSSGDSSSCYSMAPDYPEVNRAAVKEMFRQVGNLALDGSRVARSGLIIRHLILPDRIAGSREVLRFIAEEISPDTYVSLMSQYRPMYKAGAEKRLDRSITREEYLETVALVTEFNLTNCRYQGMPS